LATTSRTRASGSAYVNATIVRLCGAAPDVWDIARVEGQPFPNLVYRMFPTKRGARLYDVEFSTATPQDLLLDLLLPAQKIHTTQTLAFTAASSAGQ
jgi:hypothetical protein